MLFDILFVFLLYYRTAIDLVFSSYGEVSELAEGARLEIVYAPKAYPGFKSLPLRQKRRGDLKNHYAFSVR